jgi:hypothetical protein
MTEPAPRTPHKLKVKASLIISNDGNVAVALYPTDVKSAILLGRFYLASEVHGTKIDMGAFGQCAEDERDAPMHMVDVSISAYRKPKARKELKEIFDRPMPEYAVSAKPKRREKRKK